MSRLATVVIKPCGCICIASAEDRPMDAEMQREVGEAVAEGCSVEHDWTTARVRANPWGCDMCRPPKEPTLFDHAQEAAS